MESLIWTFDLLLGTALVSLAFHVIHSRNLYRAVVMFLVFGLLSALAWARLRAGDIALAEAAIGAGVTGALFLATIGRLRRLERRHLMAAEPTTPKAEALPTDGCER